MPRTWAITGATGLLGNNLARTLRERGERVRVLARGGPRKELDGLDVVRVDGDLHGTEALARCFDGADVVVHAAAMVWIGYGRRSELERVNVDGTRSVCAALGGRRLVHVSSVDALGLRDRARPADEDCPPAPHEEGVPYVDTKRAADRVVRESGADHVIVHPCYMLGPWDWKPSSGRMLLEIAAGTALAAPSGGNNFVHVRDVVAGVIAAADGQRGRAWILGNENLTYREAWTLFARATGGRAPRAEVPRWLGMAAAAALSPFPEGDDVNPASIRMGFLPHYFDPSRARRELGLAATPVEEAARDAWAWFRAHGYG